MQRKTTNKESSNLASPSEATAKELASSSEATAKEQALPSEASAKEGYKHTKLGWIPEEWEFVKVNSFGKVVTGSTPKTSKREFYGGEFLFITPADINGVKTIVDTEKTLTKEGFKQGREIQKGAVLFVSIGSTIGKTSIAGKKAITNQQINAIIPNDKNSGEFLFYQLSMHSKRIQRIAGVQAVPIINKSTFESIKIFRPPLPEQRQIAQILSTWDRAIEKLQQLIDKKQQLKKGLMQQLLTGKKRLPGFSGEWEEVKLGDVLLKGELGGNYKNGEGFKGLPLMKMGNIGRGFFTLKKIEYVDPDIEYEEKHLLKKSDLLFNTRNTLELVGKVAIWDNELPKALYNSNLLRLEFDPNYLASNEYANLYFNSYMGLKQLRSFAIGTTSVAAIYTRDLHRFRFLLPDLNEQKVIVKVFKRVNKEIDNLAEQLEKLKVQKKGLMQVLLTGKVRVNVN